MKKNFSLPKECVLNFNIATCKHAALKFDKPILIVDARDDLEAPAYYVSFGKCRIDMTDMEAIGKIVYQDEFGYGFLEEYYYLRDEKYLIQTRFKQFQEGVVHII